MLSPKREEAALWGKVGGKDALVSGAGAAADWQGSGPAQAVGPQQGRAGLDLMTS